MEEIIKVKNPNVLRFIINHETKQIDLDVKTGTGKSVKADAEVRKIFDAYLLKKYRIAIFVSGTEDPRLLIDKLLEEGTQKLIEANKRVAEYEINEILKRRNT